MQPGGPRLRGTSEVWREAGVERVGGSRGGSELHRSSKKHILSLFIIQFLMTSATLTCVCGWIRR